jgi:hypothetical protein
MPLTRNPAVRHNDGIRLCLTYAYPPNSLSLCGPDNRRTDVAGYRNGESVPDGGADGLLTKFKTLYPYLILIASHNRIPDPFDPSVVEAYWLGNGLLTAVLPKTTATFLTDTLGIRKSINPKRYRRLMEGTAENGIPHHAYHVFAVWRRTGNADIPHTIDSMDACIVNWGRIESMTSGHAVLTTQRVIAANGRLAFSSPVKRSVIVPYPDRYTPGDTVSYHWGVVCGTLTRRQLSNLIRFTNLSMAAANRSVILP